MMVGFAYNALINAIVRIAKFNTIVENKQNHCFFGELSVASMRRWSGSKS